MTDTITVDLERAKALLAEVCKAEPNRVDHSMKYFEESAESGNACLCVVGGVIEKLGKGLSDLSSDSVDDPNGAFVAFIGIDGVELTDDARVYLEGARQANDRGVLWGKIPDVVDKVEALHATDMDIEERWVLIDALYGQNSR